MNMLPTAIAIFSSLLKQEGHECRVFDTTYWELPEEGLFNNDEFKEKHLHVRPNQKSPIDVRLKTTDVFKEFVEEVEKFDPHLIAKSSTEDMFPLGIKLLSKIPKKNKPPVIVGGMLATFAPDLVISYDEIDMLCVGDGENLLINLCGKLEKGQDYSNVMGLWVKKNGTITRNPMDTAFSINDVPIPDVGLFEEARYYKPLDGKYYRTFPVETHRGCPYKCSYCNSPSKEKIVYSGTFSYENSLTILKNTNIFC